MAVPSGGTRSGLVASTTARRDLSIDLVEVAGERDQLGRNICFSAPLSDDWWRFQVRMTATSLVATSVYRRHYRMIGGGSKGRNTTWIGAAFPRVAPQSVWSHPHYVTAWRDLSSDQGANTELFIGTVMGRLVTFLRVVPRSAWAHPPRLGESYRLIRVSTRSYLSASSWELGDGSSRQRLGQQIGVDGLMPQADHPFPRAAAGN